MNCEWLAPGLVKPSRSLSRQGRVGMSHGLTRLALIVTAALAHSFALAGGVVSAVAGGLLSGG
jgi:hypothetical protein